MQKRKKTNKPQGPAPVYTRKVPAGPRIIAAKYNISCVKEDQYPEGDTVEVAFLGRSNVGKSSLINSLCNYRVLALVSGQPGKTKTINFFDIESKENISETEERRYNWFLVDLPGYGFAKTNKGNRDLWSSFIADYILHSPRLAQNLAADQVLILRIRKKWKQKFCLKFRNLQPCNLPLIKNTI